MTTNEPTVSAKRQSIISKLLLMLCVLLVACGCSSPTFAQPPEVLVAIQDTMARVIAKCEPCVVAISRAPAKQSRERESPFELGFLPNEIDEFSTTGVGVVVDEKGLILTQYLNVRLGDRHRVTTKDGRSFAAKIKAADPRSGLAVLEVSANGLSAIKLGDADRLRKGHFIVTVGNAAAILESGEATASWGSVTNIAQRATPTTNLNNTRSEDGYDFATTLHHLGTLIQTDAKLNWSSGGGAVVDLEGNLVGITTHAGTLPGHESPAGYAIPMSSPFRRIVETLKQGKEVEYGLIGLSLSNRELSSSTSSNSGVLVSGVLPGSAADSAGIRVGDRVLKVDDETISSVTDLQLKVALLPPAREVNVLLLRRGEQVALKVVLWKLYVPGKKVITNGERSWRGIQVEYSTALPQELTNPSLIDPKGCVAVVTVAAGSSADSAGIRPGMYVSHVGEQRVSTPDEFYAATAETDETVMLRFTERDIQQREKSVDAERQ